MTPPTASFTLQDRHGMSKFDIHVGVLASPELTP